MNLHMWRPHAFYIDLEKVNKLDSNSNYLKENRKKQQEQGKKKKKTGLVDVITAIEEVPQKYLEIQMRGDILISGI